MACMRFRASACSATVRARDDAPRQVCCSPVFQLPKTPAGTGPECATYQPLELPGLSPSTRKRCTLPSSCRSMGLCGASPAPCMACSIVWLTRPRLPTIITRSVFWIAASGVGTTQAAFSWSVIFQPLQTVRRSNAPPESYPSECSDSRVFEELEKRRASPPPKSTSGPTGFARIPAQFLEDFAPGGVCACLPFLLTFSALVMCAVVDTCKRIGQR